MNSDRGSNIPDFGRVSLGTSQRSNLERLDRYNPPENHNNDELLSFSFFFLLAEIYPDRIESSFRTRSGSVGHAENIIDLTFIVVFISSVPPFSRSPQLHVLARFFIAAINRMFHARKARRMASSGLYGRGQHLPDLALGPLGDRKPPLGSNLSRIIKQETISPFS
jgi:hypothetical protein